MAEAHQFEVWDSDNHMYETIDAYTRYLPDKYSEALKFVDVNGRNEDCRFSASSPNAYPTRPTRSSRLRAPGPTTTAGVNPEGKSLRELAEPIRCPDEFRRPDLRLALMDRQGVDGAVMFPTTAGMLEERTKSDTELTHAITHAFNRWLFDDWTFNYQNRIFAVPAISLNDPAAGVAELEWCLGERGSDGADPPRAGAAWRTARPGRLRCPSSTTSGGWSSPRASPCKCIIRTPVTTATSPIGRAARSSRDSSSRPFAASSTKRAATSSTRSRRSSHTEYSNGSQAANRCGRERRVVGASPPGRVRPRVPQEAQRLSTSTPADVFRQARVGQPLP